MSHFGKRIGLFLCCFMIYSSVAFAFDYEDAQKSVRRMYPDVMIMDVFYTEVELSLIHI